jgi:hypothetical protein
MMVPPGLIWLGIESIAFYCENGNNSLGFIESE